MTITLRDPVSGLTHFIGAILALVGTVVLVMRPSPPITPWHAVSFSVFGAAMVLLYSASTLYHWLTLSEHGIRTLRRIDHSMIFIYIAATYTPVCLIPLRGPWGWSLLGSVWGLALAGIGVKVFWLHAPRWLSTTLYLTLGWLALVGIYPLALALDIGALVWLVAGGVLYSLGATIYALKRPDPFPGFFGFHEIFHLFVIGGSCCHYILMYFYI